MRSSADRFRILKSKYGIEPKVEVLDKSESKGGESGTIVTIKIPVEN